MIILGYNGLNKSKSYFAHHFNRRGIDRNRVLGHDASAALFVDGKLIAMAEEERFTREKKTAAFPIKSINFCLKSAKISINQVDLIAFPWDFNEKLVTQQFIEILSGPQPLEEKLNSLEKQQKLYLELSRHEAIIQEFNELMSTEFKKEKFIFVPHHISHLMSGYFCAQYKDAAFFISDGRSEHLSSIMGEISRDGFHIINDASVPIKDSLGLLYGKFTRFLGFVPNNDEYKIMGLASYGNRQRFKHLIQNIIQLKPNGAYTLNLPSTFADTDEYYSNLIEYFGYTNENRNNESLKRDIASFIQLLLETATLHQIHHLESQTRFNELIFDGGVALNCVNNSHILKNSRFHDLHVSFAANDAGICIGAAFYCLYQQKMFVDQKITPYLGPEYDAENIQAALKEFNTQVRFEALTDAELYSRTANTLRDKCIIAWFQGRMEFGPRALGNRSILADPTYADIQDIINIKVKKRETFRPFAPIILDSYFKDYFKVDKKQSSDYMTFTFQINKKYEKAIPGVVHTDGTSRVQTVSKQKNARLYSLLQKFHEAFGIPCLINTSFNVQGEPIVCSPKDAIRCFLGTEIDFLVLGNYWVEKSS